MGSTTLSVETLTATGNGRSLVSSSGRHEAAARILTDTEGREYLVLRARFSPLAAPNASRPPLDEVQWSEPGQWTHIALDEDLNIIAIGVGGRERHSFELVKRALRAKGIIASGGEGSRTRFHDPEFQNVGTETLKAWLRYWKNDKRSPDVDEEGRPREWHIGKLEKELRARGHLADDANGTELAGNARELEDERDMGFDFAEEVAMHDTGGVTTQPREAVELFRDAEDAYLGWIAQHPDAYVVNTTRTPTPSYLQLHIAGCWQISSPREPGAYTEHDYIKICSTSRRAIERWAEDDVGGQLGTGCVCLS